MSQYSDPSEYFSHMLAYRKHSEPNFSIRRETSKLRKISPTLVSLIVKQKRKITLDRARDLALLMGLSATERRYFVDWVERTRESQLPSALAASPTKDRHRQVSSYILKDWLNVYVKDCFQIPAVQQNPNLVFKMLSSLATRKRIEGALKFLIKEGFLRKTLDGHIVVETELVVSDQNVPDRKVRQFHKAALTIARNNIELFTVDDRIANALIQALDDDGFIELRELLADFAEKMKKFSEDHKRPGTRLYQLVINLSPTGEPCPS